MAFPPKGLWLLWVTAAVAAGTAVALGELKGRELRACALVETPYVERTLRKPATGNFSGVAIEVLERLRDNFGFTVVVSPWEQSFNSMVDALATCAEGNVTTACPCDIAVSSFTRTSERFDRVSFVEFANEAHQAVARTADLKLDPSKEYQFVFRTFSLPTWGLICCAMVLHAIGSVFFGPYPLQVERERGGARYVPMCLLHIWRLPTSILHSYAHLIGHPFVEHVSVEGGDNNRAPSFLHTAWLLLGLTCGLFLLSVYEASLTVLLFESDHSSPLRSIVDVKNCVINPSRVAFLADGASQKFWKDAINVPDSCVRASEGRDGFPVPSFEVGFEAVRNGTVDYFYTLSGQVHLKVNSFCSDFVAVGDQFFSTSVGMIMPTALSDIAAMFSREVRYLREQDAFTSVATLADRTKCDDSLDATVTPQKLWLFFALALFCWAALLAARLFVLCRVRKRRQRMQDAINSDAMYSQSPL